MQQFEAKTLKPVGDGGGARSAASCCRKASLEIADLGTNALAVMLLHRIWQGNCLPTQFVPPQSAGVRSPRPIKDRDSCSSPLLLRGFFHLRFWGWRMITHHLGNEEVDAYLLDLADRLKVLGEANLKLPVLSGLQVDVLLHRFLENSPDLIDQIGNCRVNFRPH